MSKPLAMNMYVQNASGIWVPMTGTTGGNGNVNVAQIGGVNYSQIGPGSVPANNVSPYVQLMLQHGGGAFSNWGDVQQLLQVGQTAYGLPPEVPYLFNGTSYDAQSDNRDGISLISATAVTTTQASADQTNVSCRGVRVYLNTTAIGTGSVTLHIQGKDPVSGNYDDILVGNAVVTNTFLVYKVYPGIAASANASASDIIPRTWRVQVVANNANATTYTVSMSLEV